MSLSEFCGTSFAAKKLGLSVGTVQSLVEKNELKAWKTDGGHRRISMQSIAEYQKRYDQALAMLKQLGEGKNRQDMYRTPQVRYPVK